MKKMLLIVNPISGTGGDKTDLINRIVEHLDAHDIHVDVAPTACSGDATRLAREGVEDGYDAVLACGGDGTINETACGMMRSGVPMGILPAGSGNGLARHLCIPVDPIQALDIIVDGHFEDCDCGTVEGRPFFCTFGMGYDAAVADRFANSGHRGKVSYIRSAIEELLHFSHEHYTIRVDGKTFADDAFLIACCNASQYGNNAYIAPHASITDGLLDMIIIRKASVIETLMVTVDLVTGTIDRNRIIDTIPLREAVISRPSEGPAHIDGEPVTLGDTIHVRCEQGVIRMFTPRDRSAFRPIITPAEDLLRDAEIKMRNILN